MATRDNRKSTDKAAQTDADTTDRDTTDDTSPVTTRDSTGQAWLVNPGTTPMVYDDEGRTLPAGGRVDVEALDDTGRAAVERGYLSLTKTWDDTAKPEAPGHGASTGD